MSDYEDTHGGDFADDEDDRPVNEAGERVNACGHTDAEHEIEDRVGKMTPSGSVELTLLSPITGYDPENGSPVLDPDPDAPMGLLIEVSINSPRSLEIAKTLLTMAVGQIEHGIAARDAAIAEGQPLSEEEINEAVAAFDPDKAISGLLGGTYEAPDDEEGGHA